MSRFVAPKLQSDKLSRVSQAGSDAAGALNAERPVGRSGLTGLTSPLAPPVHPLSSRAQSSTGKVQLPESPSEDTSEGCDTTPSPIDIQNDSEVQRPDGPIADVPQILFTEDSREEEWTEAQLRKTYEDEEIERFLRHFTAHVQEVRLPTDADTASKNTPIITPAQISQATDIPTTDPGAGDDERNDVEDSAWTIVDQSYLHARKPSFPPSSKDGLSLGEKIARDYLLPNLPPVQPPSIQSFTIGRTRLQLERLILVTQPAYGPFFIRLWGYASWKDHRTSTYYCSVFWVLWYIDLLLPTFIAIILYTLLKHRIFSHPTLKELRARRRETAQAEALGQEVEKRFAIGPDFGVREAWYIFRGITKGKKKNIDKKSSKYHKSVFQEKNTTASLLEGDKKGGEDIEVVDESQTEKDLKLAVLKAMGEVADLHERVKNIFLWRRPQTSTKYTMALSLMFLVTLFVPTKYLVKVVYFVGGLFFWFVPPVILGLPPKDRSRFPPVFSDSPTDAQYAMELIAIRVARGESVIPTSTKKKKANTTHEEDGVKGSELTDSEINWQKWGDRAARGFAWVEGGKRVMKGEMASIGCLDPSQRVPGQPDLLEHTAYPAQHSTRPGLISLSSTTLSFTQVLSSKPKVKIPLEQIRGVKKSGKLGGLTVKWGLTETNEQEEKFSWVGGRDEIFAKLVGLGGRRWVQL
ncbi:hypothetical protein K439DRAFT_1414361 [Ramaria rubella]|nr:hypothetical protein K439DRAFT_1414361 [Ramaria rubella]